MKDTGITIDDLDKKVLSLFPGKVVRKDLLGPLKGHLNVPTYVLEYLLGQYCSSSDDEVIQQGLEEVKRILSENYVRPDQSEIIKSRVKEIGSHKVIDKVKVRLVETEDTYWAELTNMQLSYVNIDESLVNRYEKLLAGGVWAIVELMYDSERFIRGVLRPFVIKSIKPIQLISQGLNELEEKRAQFSREEWIDFLIRSLGLEPLSFSHRLKMLMLCRLIPLVENNYNLVELGPRGTGKSYVYRDISPYCILVSGGETTVPSLFVSHVGKGRVGLVGIWDTVAFDEVAGLTKLKDTQAVQILKDYMESGSFSRGKEQINALASLVFVGNIDFDIENILRNSHLFIPFPAEMQDAAFLDRFHAYLPGWEIPKTHPSFFGAHYGFVVDHLAEFLKELRKITFANVVDDHFKLGDTITRRDEKAIRKTISGLIKILHPDGQYSKEELEEYLQLAMELRRRVKEQLKKIGGIEFYDTHFTYTSSSGDKAIEVTVPEQESLTPVKPQTEPRVGEVLGLAISQSYGSIQKFEVIATEGTGRLIPLGSMMRVMKESLRAAYEYISRNQKNLGIKVDFKKEYDISVLATQMGVPKEGASAGITILTALVSALTKKPVRHDVAMTGEITLKGKIATVGGIQEKLVAASEAGIRKVYIPKENYREYEALPQKIKDSLEVQFVETADEVLSDAILEYETEATIEQKNTDSKARRIIEQGESERVEFKSSLRWDYKQNTKNQSLELVIAKSIAALLNFEGGTLLIGVDDDKKVLGLQNDFSTLKKQSEDGFELKLTELVNTCLGKEFRPYMHVEFERLEGGVVCIIVIEKAPKPVYVTYEGKTEFYIRSGNSSQPLNVKEANEYMRNHWK